MANFTIPGNPPLRLDQQLSFTAEIDQMTAVARRTLLLDKSRRENDAEHSWHIGVMAMLFQEYAKEPVNVGRAVQMCIVHDLVEIYAGDTFAYDQTGNLSKANREQEAANRLFSLLPEEQGKLIRDFWEEFDAMETPDSKYAACLDRIQPLLHNMLTDGHTWHENGPEQMVTRTMVEKRNAIVKEFMPEVYQWITRCLDEAVAKGWLKDE